MKNENTWFAKSVALIAIVATLAGCSTSKNNNSGGAVRTNLAQSNALAISGIALNNGYIYSSAQYATQFQSAVAGFLSTDYNPANVGTVPTTPSGNAGVYFGGSVTLSTGSLSTWSGQTTSVLSTSRFAIEVLDSTPGYNVPVLPPFVLSNATGTISGTQANLQFGDSYGSVSLVGTIDTANRLFYGVITYDNNVMYDGTTPGAAGTLGNFQVPLCSFFVCTNMFARRRLARLRGYVCSPPAHPLTRCGRSSECPSVW